MCTHTNIYAPNKPMQSDRLIGALSENKAKIVASLEIRISYDPSEFDFSIIVPFIQGSYWGQGREQQDIMQSFRSSYSVGFFLPSGKQIAWARATSDTVFHAYIFDLAVVLKHRGKGYGKRLVSELMSHPDLWNVSGWMLSTKKHHDLYRQFGFTDAESGRYMSLKRV